jgi:predicted phage tail protein
MIKVNLHGKLGQELGENWELEISTVAEAFVAIEANTKKLRKWILENINKCEYEILINKTNLFNEKKEFKTIEEVYKSELYFNIKNKVSQIDIIPKIYGEFDSPYFKVAAGAAAVAGGVALAVVYPPLAPLGIGIAIAGIGLVAGGVSELLSKPPPSVPFTAQQVNPIDGLGEAGGPVSYLFNGPVNTVGEGGPVPVGYGELIVGGNNVFSNYEYFYRAYVSDYSDVNLQVINQGNKQYLFNSKCYLVNQDPLQSLPF